METGQRTREWALDTLFGEEVRDFSADGYAAAMHRLRGESPALAQKIDRAIQPLREKDFPRRKIPWHQLSVGRRYRVAVLANNPHFSQDVALVRGVLGLPEDQVGCEGDNSIGVQLAKSPLFGEEGDDLIQYLAVRVLARRWLALHQEACTGQAPEGSIEGLTPESIAAARRTFLELGDLGEGRWLRGEPPAHPNCLWDRQFPLHLAAALLLERHCLPLHLCPSVMVHILTNSPGDLLDLESEEVLVLRDSREVKVEQSGHTASILVKGIDEYTAKADWDQIWKQQIEPVREEFWEESGQRPRGQQAPSLKRLREGLPLYKSFLELGSIEQALEAFQLMDMGQEDMDHERARRGIKDLQDLLEPRLEGAD